AALGSRTLQTSCGDVRLGPSGDVLHASRCARRDDRCGYSFQDSADVRRYGAPLRGVPQIPADSYRWTAAPDGFRTTRVVWLLDRPVGRRYFFRRDLGL